MTDTESDAYRPGRKRRLMALSRWENEGGAGAYGRQEPPPSFDAFSHVPEFTHTELVRLRMRVIALENLVMALFAGASSRQGDLAREMANYISPRPGFTPHPLNPRGKSNDSPA